MSNIDWTRRMADTVGAMHGAVKHMEKKVDALQEKVVAYEKVLSWYEENLFL